MDFLDKQIAELQKIRKIRNKEKDVESKLEIIDHIKYCELNQCQVNSAILNGKLSYKDIVLEFEHKKYFDETVSISIIKNFFDVYEEKYSSYFWYKKDKLNLVLTKFNLEESMHIKSVNQFIKILESAYKNEDVYVEFLKGIEENNGKYKRYILNYRMPTALDYVSQYLYYIELEDMAIVLLGIVLENEKEIWKKIVRGIADSLEFNIGDKCL